MSELTGRPKGERGVRRERDLDSKRQQLQAWFAERAPGAHDAIVSALRGSGEGFSNETYFFDLHWHESGEARTEELVIRWVPAQGSLFRDHDLMKQYRVLDALQGSDVPVPRLRWLEEDPRHLGVPFFIMDMVDGVVPAGRLRCEGLFFDATPEVRTQLWWRAVEIMARVHALDWEGLGLSFLGTPRDGADAADQQLVLHQELYEWAADGDRIPILDASLDWLQRHPVTPSHLALCWGDPRPGNLIYRDGHVVSVLDWEMAYIGDPAGDIAWFMALEPTYGWPFGAPPLEGIPDETETIRHYESIAGRAVENYHWHKVFQTFKLAVILIPHARNIVKAGIRGYAPDFMSNNTATQALEQLLDQAP